MMKSKKFIAILVVLFVSSVGLLRAQVPMVKIYDEATNKQEVPPLETLYSLSLHLDNAVNPGAAFNAEWALDNEWVISGELGLGYNLVLSILESQSMYTEANMAGRWYWNRARRAFSGRNVYKNSGAFLEVGVGHHFSFCRIDSYVPTINYHGDIRFKNEYTYLLNVPHAFVACGSKIVSRSNIYFSWKLGIGVGAAIEGGSGHTNVSPTLFPACHIKVGYAF